MILVRILLLSALSFKYKFSSNFSQILLLLWVQFHAGFARSLMVMHFFQPWEPFPTKGPPSLTMLPLNMLLKIWFSVEGLRTSVTLKLFVFMYDHVGI